MMMTKNYYFDNQRILTLSNWAADHAEEILDHFNVDYSRIGKRLSGPCPIHGGDNRQAFNVYPDGYDVRGFWKCRTHHCEDYFKRTFVGCIRGLMSHKKYGWTCKKDKKVSFKEAVDWTCEFLNVKLAEIDIDHEELEKEKFIRTVNIINPAQDKPKNVITSQIVQSRLDIPSKYFLDRGFSADVLKTYDVGDCVKQGKHMSNRAVVPVYDDEHRYCVGFTGRSILDRCEKCKYWHEPDKTCPDVNKPWELVSCTKWRHSKGFRAENFLYNYWFAKDEIYNTKVVILVEGPGDVWRMREAGILNCVAIFGVDLTPAQQLILERSGAMSIIVMMDNDENNAGQEASERIKKQLERTFKLYFPSFSFNDTGDLNTDAITQDVKPFIDSVLQTRNLI